MEINVRGLSCPIPVIRTKAAVEKGEKSLLIMGDTEVARENVAKYLKGAGFSIVDNRVENGVWCIKAEK